jgi:hypothetical protein
MRSKARQCSIRAFTTCRHYSPSSNSMPWRNIRPKNWHIKFYLILSPASHHKRIFSWAFSRPPLEESLRDIRPSLDKLPSRQPPALCTSASWSCDADVVREPAQVIVGQIAGHNASLWAHSDILLISAEDIAYLTALGHRSHENHVMSKPVVIKNTPLQVDRDRLTWLVLVSKSL